MGGWVSTYLSKIEKGEMLFSLKWYKNTIFFFSEIETVIVEIKIF